ncbi:MutS family DNA mismatch repair protein [Clostridium sp.]|uniref:MutS-related protein n=1 Tax=Clostridium sp. TaxID=1506 RepID=UPI002608F167|nr:MutS family DNA mismatch repair protein [Clostridium sp.]
MNIAMEFYEENIKKYAKLVKKLDEKVKVFSLLRLIIVLEAVGIGYYFYKKENIYLIFVATILNLIGFMIVAYFHNTNINQRNEFKIYIDINKRGIDRVKGNFKNVEDKGEEFLKDDHGFINDLDIFGRNSLFQMINSTKTKFGRSKLAKILSLEKLPERNKVQERQEAIKELAEKADFRQKLEVKSTFKKSGIKEIEDILKWSKEDFKFNKSLMIIPYIFIGFTFIIITLIIIGKLQISYLILMCLINYIVVKIKSKELRYEMDLFEEHKKDIEAYKNILELLDKEEFNSKYLKDKKNSLKNKDNKSAYEEMKKLNKLIDWIGDSKANAYYLIINVILLMDLFILKNIENWKKENGKYLEEWLNTMGEFEALGSISNLDFDFENWSYPEITDEDIIEGNNIGHPMISTKAVVNSFDISGKHKVALITGSNMSGKSTFLRTVGLNLVLSYIGAPTFSKSFKCGIFNIYTCMRTKDNLEESISSFYAEILRIKILIEAAKNGEKVFFLLDEIFKGTNSKDRHDGAIVLINQLVNNKALGMVSTHDLELCDLEKTKDWIRNYNFQEYYENNNIKFDYKLREGRSKTQNAIHLMKLAGIDF